MKVRVLCVRRDRPDLVIGELYDLPDGEATGYIQAGDVEKVTALPEAERVAPPAPEAAVAPPVEEQASLPRASRHRG